MGVIASALAPGLLTTIQDLGRPGLRHLGVPLSGAADPLSLALANATVGNAADAACLECTLQGPTLQFRSKVTFALAGADMDARLNARATPLYEPQNAEEGDTLALGRAKTGARAYVAFAGGLSGDLFLDSRSTYPPAEFGGLAGRALKTDDMLKSAGSPRAAKKDIPDAFRLKFTHEFFLRAITGPEMSALTKGGVGTFFSTRWTVGRRADRMGMQLEGETLSLMDRPPMASSPVFPGTVQCPRDGAPFILLSDAQTVGGYPRIAQIIAADLPLTGQMRPGDHLWFRQTSADEARDIARKKAALLAEFFPGGFYR